MKRDVLPLAAMVALIGLSGCDMPDTPSETPGSSTDVASTLVVKDIPPGPDPAFKPLTPESSLARLSPELAKTALARSAAVQEARAARSSIAAARAARTPRVLPTGSADLTDGETATIGVSLEQSLWDGGRTSARITEQELRYTDATLRAWAEQNDLVRDGLEAYILFSEATAKSRTYSELASALEDLSVILTSRVEGGVADRGEQLQLDVALQEVRRERLSTASDRDIAAADLIRLLPPDITLPKPAGPTELIQACNPAWPKSEAPADAIARLRTERQKAAEELLRARRFPRLVLAAGAAIGAATTPGVGVQIDASDMLGPGAKATVDAARAETEAALVAYNRQKVESRSTLEQLEAEKASLQSEETALKDLIAKNRDSLQLYREQLEAGTIQITDGIALLQEISRAEIQLIEAQTAIALNCVRSAAFRGYLLPIGVIDEG